jgi:HEPN domain-containing protein
MSARKHKIIPGSPEQWLRHAESDFLLGKLGRANQDILPEQICFHAQQSIEKSLKGFLVSLGLSFPPVHDIEQLLDILRKSKIALPSWSEELLETTPYAVETRYPGDWEEITLSEIAHAIELAEKTLNWAKKKIVK